MKYKNAADILPEGLLKEVQSYIDGEILYVPKATPKMKWGAKNGSKDYYLERNKKIKQRFCAGESMEQLAEFYGLAHNTIHKIIYDEQTHASEQ